MTVQELSDFLYSARILIDGIRWYSADVLDLVTPVDSDILYFEYYRICADKKRLDFIGNVNFKNCTFCTKGPTGYYPECTKSFKADDFAYLIDNEYIC